MEAAAETAARAPVAIGPKSIAFLPIRVGAEEQAQSLGSLDRTDSSRPGLTEQVSERARPQSSLHMLAALLERQQMEATLSVDGVLNQVAVVEQFEEEAESVLLTESYRDSARNLTETGRSRRAPNQQVSRRLQQSSSWWDQFRLCITCFTCFREQAPALSEREQVFLEMQALVRRDNRDVDQLSVMARGDSDGGAIAYSISMDGLRHAVQQKTAALASRNAGDTGGAGSSGASLAGAPAAFAQQSV